MRETWVRPMGLITQPNEIGVYPPGAMSQAADLIARAPGQLENRQQTTMNSNFALSPGSWVTKMIHTGSQLVYVNVPPAAPGGGSVFWITGGVVTNAPVPDGTNMFQTFNGWADAMIFRDRLIVSSEGDIIIADSLNPTTTAERTFRCCSMPQPRVSFGSSSVNPQALGAQRACGYAVLYKRVFADGYEVIGPPSPVLRFTNTNATLALDPQVITINFSLMFPALLAGDIIEFYRTQSVDFASGENPDPGTTCYLVGTHVLTSADLAAGFYTYTDTAKDGPVGQSLGGLGRAMYTNPGQAGLEGANTPPPAAKRIATYKGRAFYANYSTPGEVVLSMRGGSGALDDPSATVGARQSGVGKRDMVVSTTSGTPNVTGVSAAEFVGMVTGQQIGGSVWSGFTGINSFNTGAGTLVTNRNANATASSTVSTFDLFEIRAGYTGALLKSTSALQDATGYVVSARTISDYNRFAYDQAYYLTNLYFPTTSLFLRATNGSHYDPPLPNIFTVTTGQAVATGETPLEFKPKRFKNGVRWSKDQQPEAVPPTNEIFVGQGEIYGMYSTRDALWIFASDGLWRLSGTMARTGQIVDVRVDPVDSTLILAGPQAGCVLRDSVYAYTNRGLVRVDDNGIAELSERRVGNLLPGSAWDARPLVFVCADEANDDIYLTIRPNQTLATDLTYCYSTQYDLFTTCSRSGGFLTPVAYAYDKVSRRIFSATCQITFSTGETWILTDTGNVNWRAVTVDFQPVYAEDPVAMKQWIDMELILAAAGASVTSIDPRWEKVTEPLGSSTNVPTLTGSQESRINYGVPRSCAIGNAVVTGFAMAATTFPVGFKAASLRFEFLTEQQGFR